MMTSPVVLLCLAVLLALCSTYCAAGSVNCRKFVYHPKCRGVAAKRSELATGVFVHRPAEREEAALRRVEDEGLLGEPDLVGMEEAVVGGRPRLAAPGLWTLLADRSAAGLLLARAPKRPTDPDSIDLSYDYE